MPQFRIKNLLVDVVSGAEPAQRQELCVYPSVMCLPLISPNQCHVLPSPCYAGTCHVMLSLCHNDQTCLLIHSCPGVSADLCDRFFTTRLCPQCQGATRPDCGYSEPVGCEGSEVIILDLRQLVINPEVLKQVQAELDKTLQAVAERSPEILRQRGPQTREQAEQLEKELQAALDEVRNLKNTLK